MTVLDKPWTQPVQENEMDLDTAMYPKEFASMSLGFEGDGLSQCYVFTGDTLGSGERGLGEDLLKRTLEIMAEKRLNPNYIVLLNSAVFLAQETSEAFSSLQALAAQGVSILVSEESIDFYELRSGIKTGTFASMNEILVVIHGIDKVITL